MEVEQSKLELQFKEQEEEKKKADNNKMKNEGDLKTKWINNKHNICQ